MADARNGGAVLLEADAVLFDNDGVLVDSHDQVALAWGRLAVELGLDIDVLLADLAGVRAVDTLGRHLPPDETVRAAARLEDLEVELAGSTRPLPGALELIDQLQSRPWAIVTSAGRRLAVARWRGAGVPVPSVAITAEDVSSGKPDPEPFLVAAAALGVEPSRCLAFEDSPSGGASAQAAGATVVAVGPQPWGRQPAARVADLSQVAARAGSAPGAIVFAISP